MYKILLVSHGAIAKGFYDTLPMILGTQEDVEYLCFNEATSLEEYQSDMENLLFVDWKEDEVLVLADMMNGTPSRIAAQIIVQRSSKGKVLCGLNLQALLEAYMKKNETLIDVADSIVKAGQPSFMIVNVSDNEENE